MNTIHLGGMFKYLFVAAICLHVAVGASGEVTTSTATPVAAFDFYGNNTGAGVQSGDVVHTDGLQMVGWAGAWATMPINQGSGAEVTGTSNSITLRWAVGGVGATEWAYTAGSGTALRRDYYYLNNAPRYGGVAVTWRLEGLVPGASYDLIFYGTLSTTHTDAAFAISGHDAGNGVGNAVTLDTEADGNFLGVVADANGYITGTFDDPIADNNKEANVAGIQVAAVPPPQGTLIIIK